MLNLLLPWRWKHKIDAVLNAKFDSTRDSLIGVLNDIRSQLEARIDRRFSEQGNEIAELGDGTINGLKETRVHVDARLAEQTTHLQGMLAQQDADLSELGDGMVTALKDLQTQLESWPTEQRAASEAMTTALNNLEARLETQFVGQEQQISELREEAYNIRQALTTEFDDASLHRLRSAAADVRRGLAALKNEIAAQLGFSLHDMATQIADQRRWLDRLSAGLERISVEATNRLTHLDTSLHSRLNTLENVELPALGEQIHEIAAAQIRFSAHQANRSAWRAHPEERYAAASPEPFEAYLARAARAFPKLFEMWRERLDATRHAFEQTKVGNAAFAGDLYSRIFRDFFEAHATGRVLDIGCGVFGRPYYLGHYPAELISGLEPLPMQEAPDFELVQGLSEYLPWPDGSFSTAVSATSLDHCLSLRRSLAEIVRVLRLDGRVLLWVGSNPGAPRYDPDDPEFAPADQFHLFHFDKTWFEPLLDESFDLVDRLELKRPGYSHILYCLRPKHAVQPETSVFPEWQVAGSSR